RLTAAGQPTPRLSCAPRSALIVIHAYDKRVTDIIRFTLANFVHRHKKHPAHPFPVLQKKPDAYAQVTHSGLFHRQYGITGDIASDLEGFHFFSLQNGYGDRWNIRCPRSRRSAAPAPHNPLFEPGPCGDTYGHTGWLSYSRDRS